MTSIETTVSSTETPSSSTHCPCQSKKAFKDCCEPFLKGGVASSPEALMRSRYCAFTLDDMDYIEKTMQGPALARHVKDNQKNTVAAEYVPLTWVDLEIVDTTMSADKTSGTVRFNAYYMFNDKKVRLTENSLFKLIEGKWYYYDVKDLKEKEAKVGRNDLCPCGSHKKYKKCCGAG